MNVDEHDITPRRRGLFGGWVAWVILLVLLVVVLAVVALWGALFDEDEEEGEAAASGLIVSDAWVRATTLVPVAPAQTEAVEDTAGEGQPVVTVEAPGGMPGAGQGGVTAAYMTLTNNADDEDALVSVTCDDAQVVEMHETTMEGDVMQMRPLEEIRIPADSSVSLEPGGLHLMLLGLDADLEPGQSLRLTLTFSSGKQLTVEAEVRAAGMEG